MRPLGPTARHIQLVNGMAKSVGADLKGAVETGRLDQTAYAEMVTRCRGCAAPGDCEGRLRGPEAVEEPPTYCRNADVLKALIP